MFDLNLTLWWFGIGLACLILIAYLVLNARQSKREKKVIDALSVSATTSAITEENSAEPVFPPVIDIQHNHSTETIQAEKNIIESPAELEAVNFPGEDPIDSQLDLARAYIDMGKKNLSTKILEKILLEGNEEQKEIAKVLLRE